MREFLRHLRTKVTFFWQNGSHRRLAKLGGFITLAFALIAGSNLLFGSREAARAVSNQFPGSEDSQDLANLPFKFQFIGQGQITGGSDEQWIIGDLPIQVIEQTQLTSDLHPGDFVTLSGRILDNKIWLADRIEVTQAGEAFFTFNSPLEWVRGTVWRIGGYTFSTDPHTKIGRDLVLNDFLLTTFTVLENGGWLALEIKAFERFPLEPTPIPSATPVLSPNPTSAPVRTEVSAPKPSGNAKEKSDRPPKSKKNSHSKDKAKGHQKNNKK
jgi:hypothetical protein